MQVVLRRVNRICSKRLSSPTVKRHFVGHGLSTSVHVHAPNGVGILKRANGCTDGFFLDMHGTNDRATLHSSRKTEMVLTFMNSFMTLGIRLKCENVFSCCVLRKKSVQFYFHFFFSEKTIMESSKSLSPQLVPSI